MNRRNFLKSIPFIGAAIPALLAQSAVPPSLEVEPIAEEGHRYDAAAYATRLPGPALYIGDDGAIYVSGEFVNNIHLMGVTSRRVAKWNTDAWSKLF